LSTAHFVIHKATRALRACNLCQGQNPIWDLNQISGLIWIWVSAGSLLKDI